MAKNKSDIVYTVMNNGSYWKVSYKENELSVCFNVEKKLCETEAEVIDYVKRQVLGGNSDE